MNFRQVVPATLAALAPWPHIEFTILRDTMGRVRVLVESTPQPGANDLAAIEAALRAAIGAWLGAATPVWAPDNRTLASVARLIALIRQDRRAVPGHNKVWILERHAARHAWTGDLPHAPPWPIDAVDSGQKPPILTYFSHKGGTGRTTALAACAIQIARAGKNVMLLDLDLEAPGLGSVFGSAGLDEGLVDLLLQDQAPEQEIQAITATLTDEALIGSGAPIRLLHAGRVDADYMEMLARLDTHSASNRSGLTLKLQALFLSIVRAYPNIDYILVDARAGFHDLGGLMLASLSHGAIVVGTASEQSWLGLELVARLLRGSPDKEPIPLIAVHGMAPEVGARDETPEISAFRDRLYDTLCAQYYPKPVPAPAERGAAHDALAIAWNAGLRGQGGAISGRVIHLLAGPDYQPLVDRITALFPATRDTQ